MATLEELSPGIHLKGLLPGRLVILIEVKLYGDNDLEVTYKDASVLPGTMLYYQRDAVRLEIASQELLWNYEVDYAFFCIILKNYRISLEYLFDLMITLNQEQ